MRPIKPKSCSYGNIPQKYICRIEEMNNSLKKKLEELQNIVKILLADNFYCTPARRINLTWGAHSPHHIRMPRKN